MLPQLSVSAKILCLLMVVICGVMPATLRSVNLFHDCSSKYVQIHENGTIITGEQLNGNHFTGHLTISTESDMLKLLIYANFGDKNIFLCFLRGRIVGKKLNIAEARKSDACLFYEEDRKIDGYYAYKSVKECGIDKAGNATFRYMGFNKKNLRTRRIIDTSPAKDICSRFMKRPSSEQKRYHHSMPVKSNFKAKGRFQNKPRQKNHHRRHGKKRSHMRDNT